MLIDEYKRQYSKEASILTLGGFKPTNNQFASHFGLIPLSLPGERWPFYNNKPLFFVCQLNLSECTFVPEILQDIKLITFFITSDISAIAKENGFNWVLRTYDSLDYLVPMEILKGNTFSRGFEGRWETKTDYPVFDDPEIITPEGFDRSSDDLGNIHHTKIGGYASNIQAEQWWGYENHPSNPTFCFQIDSEDKISLLWGNSSTIYFARGTTEGTKNQWFLDWQCY
jgi:uncharacterized protein YwqG